MREANRPIKKKEWVGYEGAEDEGKNIGMPHATVLTSHE